MNKSICISRDQLILPQVKIADITNKKLWASKLKNIQKEFKEVHHQERKVAEKTEIQKVPNPDEFISDTLDSIPGNYKSI